MALLAAIATATALFVEASAADNYPNRPIVLVIPLPPGGTNDIMARAVSDKMSAALGQRIVIENRNAGGSGTVGTREVARAAPDGYTIILGYTSTLATGPHLYKDAGYDPRKDFAPIGLIASAPALLLVYKDVPVHSVGELIAMMKSAKEPFQVGTPGAGTVNYLASILFAQQAGVNVQQIVEKGSNPLITDMMGGFVKVGFNPIPVSRAALDGGYIRRAGGDVGAAFDFDAAIADACGIRIARLRRDADLRPAGAGRHAEADHRAAEQGIARGARQPGREEAASSIKAANRPRPRPKNTPQWSRANTTKWGAVIRDAGIEPQ